MKKFEYKFARIELPHISLAGKMSVEEGIVVELNKLGQEGWELVEMRGWDCTFKREIENK